MEPQISEGINMAYLVCYSEAQVVDWEIKALYLEQSFYELLFEHCRNSVGYPLLGSIGSLTYDDEIMITDDQLDHLLSELREVLDSPGVPDRQISAFIEVVQNARHNRLGLAIAGDMHPVLKP